MSDSFDHFKAWVSFWKPKLGINDWNIRVDAVKVKADSLGMEMNASISPQWMYKQAHMDFNLKTRPKSYMEICNTALHELLHCVVSPMSQDTAGHTSDLEELTVSNLAIAFQMAYSKDVEKYMHMLQTGGHPNDVPTLWNEESTLAI